MPITPLDRLEFLQLETRKNEKAFASYLGISVSTWFRWKSNKKITKTGLKTVMLTQGGISNRFSTKESCHAWLVEGVSNQSWYLERLFSEKCYADIRPVCNSQELTIVRCKASTDNRIISALECSLEDPPTVGKGQKEVVQPQTNHPDVAIYLAWLQQVAYDVTETMLNCTLQDGLPEYLAAVQPTHPVRLRHLLRDVRESVLITIPFQSLFSAWTMCSNKTINRAKQPVRVSLPLLLQQWLSDIHAQVHQWSQDMQTTILPGLEQQGHGREAQLLLPDPAADHLIKRLRSEAEAIKNGKQVVEAFRNRNQQSLSDAELDAVEQRILRLDNNLEDLESTADRYCPPERVMAVLQTARHLSVAADMYGKDQRHLGKRLRPVLMGFGITSFTAEVCVSLFSSFYREEGNIIDEPLSDEIKKALKDAATSGNALGGVHIVAVGKSGRRSLTYKLHKDFWPTETPSV